MAPENHAATLVKPGQVPLVVETFPYASPKAGELVIKSHAWAMNPVDALLPKIGHIIFPWLKFPVVPGIDVSGEVYEIGKDVEGYKVGDRVVCIAAGCMKGKSSQTEGAFQEYVVVLPEATAHMPDDLSYAQAAVLPLAMATAAAALYTPQQLGLPLPTVNEKKPVSGEVLLIWGGSTSVGSCAIQLAVHSGYKVITTASPRNFEYCRQLGASQVFDYRSPTVTQDIIATMEDQQCAGAAAIGNWSAEHCMDVIRHCNGKKYVAMISPSHPEPRPTVLALPRFMLFMMRWNMYMIFKRWWTGVGSVFVLVDPLFSTGIAKKVFAEFLLEALAKGVFVAKPNAEVYGKGVGKIWEACLHLEKGVSAKKIVVTAD